MSLIAAANFHVRVLNSLYCWVKDRPSLCSPFHSAYRWLGKWFLFLKIWRMEKERHRERLMHQMITVSIHQKGSFVAVNHWVCVPTVCVALWMMIMHLFSFAHSWKVPRGWNRCKEMFFKMKCFVIFYGRFSSCPCMPLLSRALNFESCNS